MKFIKGLVLAVALAVSSSVFAKSQEEVCYSAVETEVELKHLLSANADQFNLYLELLDKHKVAPMIKKRMRETAYWVYNRKDLSDGDFRRLAFLRCLVQTS